MLYFNFLNYIKASVSLLLNQDTYNKKAFTFYGEGVNFLIYACFKVIFEFFFFSFFSFVHNYKHRYCQRHQRDKRSNNSPKQSY